MGKKENEDEKRLETERLKKLEEERTRNLQRLQDEAKEYGLRKAILEDSCQYFDNLLQKVRNYKTELRNNLDWLKYLKCEKIPNTKIPSDIRSFLYKFQSDFEEYHGKKVNWWLQCDDRSDMNQDVIRNPDIRRRVVEKLRKPTGSFYDKQMRLLMKAYESLEDVIRRKKVEALRLNDLLNLQKSFRETALNFLDALSLEIILHIDREMNSMTPLIAQYRYSSPDFIKFIWSFKDVTLPPNRNKFRSINMEPLRMIVTMSSSLDLELSAVRGLWLKRDFFSDFCPSFNSLQEMKFLNLAQTVEMEMKERQKITEKHLNVMRKKRADYEKRMEELAKEEKQKKEKSEEKKKKVIEIEPPIVDESTYVDVENEYVAFEFSKFREEMDSLSPEKLNLGENDVNMREYQILGGIYKVECLLKPIQTKEINFQLFLRLNELPNILKFQPFNEIYKPPKMKQTKDERKSQFGLKFQEAKDEALSSLIKIEIKLSDKIIWWESPLACRWEPWEESDEFQQFDPKIQDYNINHEKYIKREQEKLFKVAEIKKKKKIELNDFQLAPFSENIKLSTLIEKYLAPLIPCDFPLHIDEIDYYEKKQKAWKKYVDNLRAKRYRSEEIGKFLLLDEFMEKFVKKNLPPRNLFPIEYCKKIKVLENLTEKLFVEIKREELKMYNKPELNININEDYPIKNEPIMLSDFIAKIEEYQKNLQPNFVEDKVEIFLDNKDQKKKKKKMEVDESTKVEKDFELILIPHEKGKWSTRDIYEQSYDAESKILTFYAGRMGNFGIATKKFINLPLKTWELFPVNEKIVTLRIEAQNISIEFQITEEGYTFKIIKPLKAPIQEIKKPLRVFELKKLLTSMNVNLFPEIDSDWYVENNAEKHRAMEFHAYQSMATYCLSHHFMHSTCNNLTDYRSAIIKSRQIDKKTFRDILMTPLRVISIKLPHVECCTDHHELTFEMDPSNQEFCPDLLNFLKPDVDKSVHRVNQQNFMTIWFTQALLMNIRPLSFSE